MEVIASMRVDYKCPVTQGGVNSLRNALLENGLAEEHHWVPNSGWITFQIRSEEDLSHALWLTTAFIPALRVPGIRSRRAVRIRSARHHRIDADYAVRTSIGSLWQNGVAERWVGSCRRELLDHVIALNERHLKQLSD